MNGARRGRSLSVPPPPPGFSSLEPSRKTMSTYLISGRRLHIDILYDADTGHIQFSHAPPGSRD